MTPQDTKNEYSSRLEADLHSSLEKRLQWLEERYGNFNSEMGKVQSSVEWLTWAVRWLIAGVGATMFFTLVNLVIALVWLKK